MKFVLVFLISIAAFWVTAHEDHPAKANSATEPHEEDGSHNHEEEVSFVGPDKGVLEAKEDQGIKLSTEAEKNFEISKVKISNGLLEIPKRALVTAGTEINVYRFRGGFYKRVDCEVVKQNAELITIKSSDLKIGDEIVTRGVGFIRLAELMTFDDAPEGHSH